MQYQIEIREIPPIRVAYTKYRGIAAEANKVFPNVFKSVRGKTNGAPFFSYLAMNPETKQGDMELCVTHVGSYETLPLAYDAIDKYAADNGLLLEPPFREVFIKGPGMLMRGNPDKYITEIQFPVKEG